MKRSDFGKRILELRQQNGLTQSELAEKCNLSLRTVQRIETSEVTPRNYTLRVIFGALGHDLESESNQMPQTGTEVETDAKKWYGIKELFNLKTDTMKKLSVLTLSAALLFAGIFFTANAIHAQKLSKIEGWHLAGSHPGSYEVGIDKAVFKTGGSSAYLGSTAEKIEGFGTLMQSFSAADYLGKRVKMTAWVKSKDVAGWAGMWLRIDGKTVDDMLGFDNMQNRPIKGTGDWKKCEIVLDVPTESVSLNFGILLAGTGKVWFDDPRRRQTQSPPGHPRVRRIAGEYYCEIVAPVRFESIRAGVVLFSRHNSLIFRIYAAQGSISAPHKPPKSAQNRSKRSPKAATGPSRRRLP